MILENTGSGRAPTRRDIHVTLHEVRRRVLLPLQTCTVTHVSSDPGWKAVIRVSGALCHNEQVCAFSNRNRPLSLDAHVRNLFASPSYSANSNCPTLRRAFSHVVSYWGLAPHLLAPGLSTCSCHVKDKKARKTCVATCCPDTRWPHSYLSRHVSDPSHQLQAKHTSHTYCQDIQKAVATTATPSNCCDISTTRGPTTQTTPSTVIFLSIDMGKLCSEIFQ